MGESVAAAWLKEQGYGIISQNWRTGRWEIDIIAVKAGILHFFEVKTSRQAQFGNPEERVHKKKLGNFIRAGGAYLEVHTEWSRVQYNIIAVQWLYRQNPSVTLLEDVYLF